MSIEEEEDASLKELVTKTLQSNGVLGKIQAQLRASVFLALEEEFRDKNLPLVSFPTRQVLATREGAVAASLVLDFLQCLGLDFSLAVFSPESGHSTIWSSLGPEALSSDLQLKRDEKDPKTPLLVELVRERQRSSQPSREQNGEASSCFSSNGGSTSDSNSSSSSAYNNNKNNDNNIKGPQSAQQPTGTHNRETSLKPPPDPATNSSEGSIASKLSQGTCGVGQSSDGEQDGQARKDPLPLARPSTTLENSGDRHSVDLGQAKFFGAVTPQLPHLVSPEEGKNDSDASLSESKQYEDDFSSMSEKDGQDDGEEEEEVEEDIEEDLDDISADDLLNSNVSGASDLTKDQSLSQASNAPTYQEDL